MSSLELPIRPCVLLSTSFNPWANLSLENWLFRYADPKLPLLLLYRNRPCVVLGRFQNPWRECRLEQMEKMGVDLVRRQSGGGTVYHDLGNLNYSFINGPLSFSTAEHFHLILKVLQHFDIPAYANHRHDLVVEHASVVRKFSGSAFKKTRDRSIHHGTLLISANLDQLKFILKPKIQNLSTKAIASVVSPVVNLTEINPKLSWEDLSQSLSAAFYAQFNANYSDLQLVTENEILGRPEILDYFSSLSSWQWRLGETPRFTHQMEKQFTWGRILLEFNCQKGVVTDLEMVIPGTHPALIQRIKTMLCGERYELQCLLPKLKLLQQEFSMYAEELADLTELLVGELQ